MDLETHLRRRIQPVVNQDVGTVMAIVAGNTRLVFALTDRGLNFEPTLEADATFTFDSAETALAVLTGTEDPIAAFLDGRFRSDGHLPLAFVLLGLFRPGVDTTPPP